VPYNSKIPGWMSEADLQTLEILAARVPKCGTVTEIGSFLGRSASVWGMTCDPSVSIYCIDTWGSTGPLVQPGRPGVQGDPSLFNGSYEGTFRELTKGFPNIQALRGYSTTNWGIEKCNLIFVDGDHSYAGVKRDLEFWYPRLAPGGVIVGHDFTHLPRLIGVAQAAMEFAWKQRLSLFVPAGSVVWMMFKDQEHMNSWWPTHSTKRKPDQALRVMDLS